MNCLQKFEKAPGLPMTTADLLRRAERDPDRAVVWVLGEDMARAEGAIIVIKGQKEVEFIRGWLERQRLLTPEQAIPE